jgi:hypothetical protein
MTVKWAWRYADDERIELIPTLSNVMSDWALLGNVMIRLSFPEETALALTIFNREIAFYDASQRRSER